MIDFDSMTSTERALALAEYVQERLLSKGYTVHRYDAISTQSIYLKVDYGVGGSIRIADHKGKQNLNYRFNLQVAKGGKGKESIQNKVCDRHFYHYGSVDTMLKEIVNFREDRVRRYGGIQRYATIVNNSKKDSANQKGFWSHATTIKLEPKGKVAKWLKKNKMTHEEMDTIVQQVRVSNEKLDNMLKNTRNGWEGLIDTHLDLVITRYKELNKPVEKVESTLPQFVDIEGLMDIVIN